MKQEILVSERSIVTRRVFPHGAQRVWTMWSELTLLERWWGPDGFTTSTSRFQFEVGGSWVFVMVGPDGVEYQNEIVYEQIEKPSRIRYAHISNKRFTEQVDFVETAHDATEVVFTMVFESQTERDSVKLYAEPGNRQFMEKLSVLLDNTKELGRSQTLKTNLLDTLEKHFQAISRRDIDEFQSHLTKSERLYTIVQNGYAFTTPSETLEILRQWFQDPNWIWEGEVVHSLVGQDVGMALVKYSYRTKPDEAPVVSWLTYVLALEEGEWKIVHDHSTALDFGAFARMAGIEISR